MSESLLTNELLQRALTADVGEASLTSWKLAPGSKFGDNFFNDNARVEVTFMQSHEEKIANYFAKMNPRKDNDCFNPYRNYAMRKEIFFYSELLPALNKELESINKGKLKVPKFLAFSAESEKEVIILEDACIKGFVTFDRAYPMDEDHTALMTEELSKLHTASILLQMKHSGKPLTDIYPLLIEAWDIPSGIYSEGFTKMFLKCMLNNVNFAKNLPEFSDIIPWLEKLLRNPMDTLKSYLLSSNKWMEICHGDYHRTNVLFKYENNKPVDILSIDWQTVRLAAVGSEFGYFLHSCFSGEQIEQLECPLKASFYKLLSSNLKGNVPYTLSELDAHCKSNFFGFLICFYIIPLSVCVKTTAELFLITDKDLIPSPEGLQDAKDILAENIVLRKMITDMFKYIVRCELDKKI